jgi:hypothetical protein
VLPSDHRPRQAFQIPRFPFVFSMYCTISINSARHTSQAPVLCRKLALVTGHEGQCRRGLTRDNAEKSKISSKTGHFTVFTTYWVYFGSRGLQPPPTGHKTLETANLGIVWCRNFRSVTVTGHLCRSVELVQRVTVTGVCRIERNGTVLVLTRNGEEKEISGGSVPRSLWSYIVVASSLTNISLDLTSPRLKKKLTVAFNQYARCKG